MDKLVICIKWGTMYGPEYVNVLFGMVSRNLSGPFRFVCFTDDSSGVRPEVECLPLPELGVEVPPGAPGKWPKQALWAEDLFGLQGVALFLDLDSVIVDSIDPYFEIGEPDDVYTARNWVKPWLRMSQTSVFRFKIGAHPYMLEELRKDPMLMVKYRYEQNYVSSCLKGGVKFWPSKWTKHFGIHSQGPWPLRFFRTPVIPRGARIITFPGNPKPPDAIEGKYDPDHETRTPWEHVHKCLTEKDLNPRINVLRHYFKPTPWIAEYWRE